MGVGVLFWSVMTCACGIVKSFGGLFVARMGVGIGEAALSPPAHSLLSDLYPARRLPRALSIFTLGALEPWQLTFIVVGLPGFLVGALAWTVREPRGDQT